MCETVDVLRFRDLFERLFAALGPQDWWPARSRFEMMAGAVLTQNTAWRNVESSIGRLRGAGLLEASSLAAADADALRVLIRPSGFMTAKADSLVRLARWALAHDIEVATWDDATLRASLLALRGVGPETADSIALYAYDRPLFVWDRYARRLLMRVGYEPGASYEAARRALGPAFRAGGFTLVECQEFHGLLVEAGKRVRTGWAWFDDLARQV
ncbi:MAG: hypothetical protein FWC46_04640 [Actinomycetia bacterium]|nr:hypothetical protein [Actinomycetes bacterium]